MSWNSFYKDDIEPIAAGKFPFGWTCPRCGFLQTVNVSAMDILYGKEISCENVRVCGYGESKFELVLEVKLGSYKGLMDKPLNLS